MKRIWEYQRTYGAVLDQIDPDQWANSLLSDYRSLNLTLHNAIMLSPFYENCQKAFSSNNTVQGLMLPRWQAVKRQFIASERGIPYSHPKFLSRMDSWLVPASRHIRFFDWMLYHYVRGLPRGLPLREQWTQKGIDLAIQYRNFSLTESLIIMMGKGALEQTELIKIGREFAQQSGQMRRVYWNILEEKIN